MRLPKFVLTSACVLSVLLGWGMATGQAPVELSYYLPEGVRYDPSIPTPRSVLGYEVGEWHVRHDQIVTYLWELARQSDRVTLQEIGRTHEQRPLPILTISSPRNLARIEEIRQAHLDGIFGATKPADPGPVIVWLGYSVHSPTPRSVLGYEVGEWHVRHDQIVTYLWPFPPEATIPIHLRRTS